MGSANIQNCPHDHPDCNAATMCLRALNGYRRQPSGLPPVSCLLPPVALGLFPRTPVGGQDPFAEAGTAGGDLDELVVVDELDRLFQVEQPRWDQPERVVVSPEPLNACTVTRPNPQKT